MIQEGWFHYMCSESKRSDRENQVWWVIGEREKDGSYAGALL